MTSGASPAARASGAANAAIAPMAPSAATTASISSCRPSIAFPPECCREASWKSARCHAVGWAKRSVPTAALPERTWARRCAPLPTLRSRATKGSGGSTMRIPIINTVLGALALVVCMSAACAEDRLAVAVGARGVGETFVAELGQNAGIFRKHGIVLEILYTQGGGETQQAVISGSVELGSSAGVLGVFGAYAKGAPLRIIGAEMTGGGDLFWYVQSASPIRSLADTDGKTIAYSTNGASTHAIVNAF